MDALLFASLLLVPTVQARAEPFHAVAPDAVPAELFDEAREACDYYEAAECRERFLEGGAAWAADLNEDGVEEFVIQSVPSLCGTGGCLYYLFQQQEGKWVPLTDAEGFLTGIPLLEVLPVARQGFHDIRVSYGECFRWNSGHYVPYRPKEYRELLPQWFDPTSLREAELFWKIRYAGEKDIHFEPEWFPGRPNWSIEVELEDPLTGWRWLATFKGGVYGEQDGRSFLLLPRPGYQGASKLQFQGNWLLIYGDRDEPVARYNRHTHELQVDWTQCSLVTCRENQPKGPAR